MSTPEPPKKPTLAKYSKHHSSPSIKDALSGKMDNDEKISAKEQHQLYANDTLRDVFNEEQMLKVWAKAVGEFADNPNIKSALSEKPFLDEKKNIILNITNSVQEEALKLVKPQLVSIIRKELQNSQVDLIFKIVKKPLEKIVYTDTDKYQEMVKKNPMLNTLRQEFNLDFGE